KRPALICFNDANEAFAWICALADPTPANGAAASAAAVVRRKRRRRSLKFCDISLSDHGVTSVAAGHGLIPLHARTGPATRHGNLKNPMAGDSPGSTCLRSNRTA